MKGPKMSYVMERITLYGRALYRVSSVKRSGMNRPSPKKPRKALARALSRVKVNLSKYAGKVRKNAGLRKGSTSGGRAAFKRPAWAKKLNKFALKARASLQGKRRGILTKGLKNPAKSIANKVHSGWNRITQKARRVGRGKSKNSVASGKTNQKGGKGKKSAAKKLLPSKKCACGG